METETDVSLRYVDIGVISDKLHISKHSSAVPISNELKYKVLNGLLVPHELHFQFLI